MFPVKKVKMCPFGLLLGLAALCFSSGAAGEAIRYGSDADAALLTDPATAFGIKWPAALANTYASPQASLFPTKSGSGNSVTVSGATISHDNTSSGAKGYVIGGLWYYDAGRNVVRIQNGANVGKVYGGAALGTAHDNRVYLTGGSEAQQVTGGLSVKENDAGSEASRNAVFITDSISHGTVSGGWNGSGDPTVGTSNSDSDVLQNTVRIDGNSTIHGNVYGGYNEGNSKTYGNTVTIAGGAIAPGGSVSMVAGAYSSVTGQSGITKVYGNRVVIGGGEITLAGSSDYSGIYGGRSQGGVVDVYENEVVVTGGRISGKVVSGGSGGKSGTMTSRVSSNRVTIEGGIIDAKVAGGRVNDAGTARGNGVVISGGKVTEDVYGAYDATPAAGAAAIQDNWVVLGGGTVEGNVYGGYAETGESTGNRVSLQGATVVGNIYAGSAAAPSHAKQNTVNLNGGTVTGTVNGNKGSGDWTSGTWKNSGNALIASGGTTTVGGIDKFQTAAIRSGATVNVTGALAESAIFGALENNGLLSFYNGSLALRVARINGDYSGAGKIGLEVLFDRGMDPTNADSVLFDVSPASTVVFTFKPYSGSESAPYVDGKANTLFAESPNGDLAYATAESGYGIYSYIFRRDGYRYYVGLGDAHAGEKGGVYTDASAAGLSQIALLSDSFLRTGLERAVGSLCPKRGFGVSASVGYAAHRIGTGGGGHARLNGVSGLVTMAYTKKGTPVGYGVFGEMFDGEYRTADSLSLSHGTFNMNSRGDLKSHGGGLFVQYRKRLAEAIETGTLAAWIPGPHLEMAAHAGRSVMDFTTEKDGAPSKFGKKGTPYYGASLGGGCVIETSPKFLTDLYGNGRWVRQGSRSAKDGLGQYIQFRSADSLRLEGGFRTAYRATGCAHPYAGLAGEWEALGRPGARVNGYRAKRARLSGVSGLVELGVGVKPRDCVHIDIKGSGSVGRRKGLGGTVEARYSF